MMLFDINKFSQASCMMLHSVMDHSDNLVAKARYWIYQLLQGKGHRLAGLCFNGIGFLPIIADQVYFYKLRIELLICKKLNFYQKCNWLKRKGRFCCGSLEITGGKEGKLRKEKVNPGLDFHKIAMRYASVGFLPCPRYS